MTTKLLLATAACMTLAACSNIAANVAFEVVDRGLLKSKVEYHARPLPSGPHFQLQSFDGRVLAQANLLTIKACTEFTNQIQFAEAVVPACVKEAAGGMAGTGTLKILGSQRQMAIQTVEACQSTKGLIGKSSTFEFDCTVN